MKDNPKYLIIILLLGLISCNVDPKENSKNQQPFIVTLHLPSEPDNLHPMLSKSAYATPIESIILPPLAEIDPLTSKLSPLLIETIPEPIEILEGPLKGFFQYNLVIRKEALWADNVHVTAKDYVFTTKTARCPTVNAPVWNSYLSGIKKIVISNQDPKVFSVVVEGNDLQAKLSVINFNIFPQHIYDPNNRLGKLSIETFLDGGDIDEVAKDNTDLQAFGNEFQDVKFNREIVSGAGPYELDKWETGETIRLRKKENYWAEKLDDTPNLLQAYPDIIDFRIIPDENTAIAALKDGRIDLLADISPDAFMDLKEDPSQAERFNFYTPSIMYINYLLLNNRDNKLSDVNVRKALAHVLDIDAILDNIVRGLGQRSVGPVHPSKPFYNNELDLIEFNPEKAQEYLAKSGWSDTNSDGTVDKKIDGKRIELILNILVTQKREGQQIALILKQNAAKVGVGINIETKEGAQLFADIKKFDFDIAPIRIGSNPLLFEPYQTWHSNSIGAGGGNRSGYRDAEADSIMNLINDEEVENKRNDLYRQLQATIYEDQPVIFLYVPLARIIVTKSINMETSNSRPGYFPNLFKRAS